MIHTRAQRDLRLTAHHRRGAAAVLAMMFLVIFGSLAAAMAIVAQGNLATADSQLKINRSLAAAETGMRFIEHRLALASEVVTTREGIISDTVATDLWSRVQDELLNHEDFGLKDELHNIEEPYTDGKIVHVGPIAVGPNAPAFTATLTPHPLAGEDYDSDYYQRPPYSEMETPVSSSNPLGARWIRVRVTAHDGPAGHRVTRSVSMDFEITKRIPYAILSKSRVMIGPNVLVDGPLGSAFMDTHLEHGHPIQMVSDFTGINGELDDDLEALRGTLVTNDVNKDNRISVSSESETEGLSNPSSYDLNNDGYIDDYDFFLKHFDSDGNGQVTPLEMESNVDDELAGSQLLELIDTAGYGPGDPPPSWNGDPEDYPGRPGYGDGVIDDRDRYMKVRGEVYISADAQSWNEGAADPDGTGDGEYQDYFQGPLSPDYQEAPLTFEADQNDVYEFGPEDFDVSTFRDRATGDLKTQALTQIADEHDPEDPDSPQPLGAQ
ncbi:MAG: TadE/TadG family type IV pilus assembly protein, partial [bacterium]